MHHWYIGTHLALYRQSRVLSDLFQSNELLLTKPANSELIQRHDKEVWFL